MEKQWLVFKAFPIQRSLSLSLSRPPSSSSSFSSFPLPSSSSSSFAFVESSLYLPSRLIAFLRRFIFMAGYYQASTQFINSLHSAFPLEIYFIIILDPSHAILVVGRDESAGKFCIPCVKNNSSVLATRRLNLGFSRERLIEDKLPIKHT